MDTKQPRALALANVLRGIDAQSRFANEKLSAASEALESLHAENLTLRAELVNEAKRTADEKLRADQMTQQHRMQADLNTSARAELATLRAGYDAARREIESLQAQLEAVGAAPAKVLAGVIELAKAAHAHWNADRDAKVGKILMAMAGWNEGYDWRADALHAAATTPQPAAQALDAQELHTDVARAIWEVMREYEDRCDLELEDIGCSHVVWQLANAAIAAKQRGAE